ncbi:hypothetical protein [Burkholderia ubonensis]|uniref:hypothetical protein n=1 Tax=Burkholderia ubonensis TaxID=101571 RepID=UPI00075571A3|nr:hypothetical protein [Burkholderia ubonensis]KVO83241.1 hypothetical protein WJ82_17285 [Burkholderia ubonensis]
MIDQTAPRLIPENRLPRRLARFPNEGMREGAFSMDEIQRGDGPDFAEPVTMNELRRELGEAFVESLTDIFVREIIPAALRDDVRRNIEEVRAENHDPVILEMECAMQRALLDECQAILAAKQQMSTLAELQSCLSRRRADLLEAMLRYQESAPKRNAIKGAGARHARTDEIKSRVLADWQENGHKFTNKTEFAHTWLGKEPQLKQARTIINWIKGL